MIHLSAHDWMSLAVAVIGLVAGILGRKTGKAGTWQAAVAAAVALVEKYASGAPEAQLEDEAVKLILEKFPNAPEELIRGAIREFCRRRKLKANEVGLRQ